MTQHAMKTPGPDHPITITPTKARVAVKLAGQTIAETHDALVLQEASYQPVLYIPRKDVAMNLLQRSTHQTYCPYKGNASYYSLPIGGERSINAVWSYEAPYDAVKAIKDHVAFYPDRVDSIEVDAAS